MQEERDKNNLELQNWRMENLKLIEQKDAEIRKLKSEAETLEGELEKQRSLLKQKIEYIEVLKEENESHQVKFNMKISSQSVELQGEQLSQFEQYQQIQ